VLTTLVGESMFVTLSNSLPGSGRPGCCTRAGRFFSERGKHQQC
jgi:hypothetical protein